MGAGNPNWTPGKSGNPKGRPPNIVNRDALRDLCRTHTEKAISTLIELLDCEQPSVRAKAADSLLDRGWGRPSQAIEVSGTDGGPLTVADTVRAMFVRTQTLTSAQPAATEPTDEPGEGTK